jgi:phosphohistidine phosphatase
MLLFLLRHATAEDHGLKPDAERALVEKGCLQARRAGAFCRAAGCLPELVLTSPRLRARETAEGFCKAAGLSSPLVVPWLDCGCQPEQAVTELAGYVRFASLCLVGHEPDFSSLAAHFLGAAGAVRIKKASLAAFDFPAAPRAGAATLEWLVPSRLMRVAGA